MAGGVDRAKLALGIIGFVGIMDTAFLMGIISPYAEALGASKPQAGLIAGLYSMVAIPASLLAGVVVDKVGRKKSMMLGLAWDTLSVYAYGLASTVQQLALVRGIHAVGGSLVYPAFMASVGDRSGGRLGSHVGGYLAVVAASIAVGTLASAGLVATLGFSWVFRILALIVASGLLAALAVEETAPAERERPSILEGLKAAKGDLAAGLILVFTLYMSFGMIVGGLGPALRDAGIAATEERAAALTGMSIGIATLVSIPFLVATGRLFDRGNLAPVLVASAAALSGSQLLLLANPGTASLAAAYSIYGIGLAGYMAGNTYLVLKAPPHARGSAVGLQQMVNIVGVAVGAPLAGLLVKAGGLTLLATGIAVPPLLGLASLRIASPAPLGPGDQASASGRFT